jgi:transcriptional regulator with PAS, ATPase and Fis domain
MRVGGERPLHSDVRVITATNTDLGHAAEKGRFRKDLLERLQVIAVRMPPLRERRTDVDELAAHFLQKYCRQEDRPSLKMDAAALQVLRAFDYPGNVRELESAMRSIVSLKEAGDTLVLGDLPLKFFQGEEPSESEPSPLLSLTELEKQHVTRVLQATGGNKAKAARILGISRPTLDRKIQRHDISATSSVTRK